MELRLADEHEIPALTALSKAAFDTDSQVGSPEPGGPPEYDSVPWHQSMRAQGHLYSLLKDGVLVGGMLLFRDGQDVLYVGRVFIAPCFQRQGYGLEAMRAAERLFPGVRVIRLDTPVWNRRTNRFYPRLGYAEVRRDAESVYYEKRLEPA
ncbi:MAG: GNAT family N-acetyltransferase [Eubacteriales bacterium]|nr:GNAT family N-acetyltransferase [Eubacteriales bacterium]